MDIVLGTDLVQKEVVSAVLVERSRFFDVESLVSVEDVRAEPAGERRTGDLILYIRMLKHLITNTLNRVTNASHTEVIVW